MVARSWGSFLAAIAEDFDAGEARFDSDDGFRESFGSRELRIRPCHGARDDTFLEVLKARVRLREGSYEGEGTTGTEGCRKDSPAVDLMVNSPRIMTGDGFPSPNLPRESESITGSPVIETPISTILLSRLPRRKDTVTLSGPELLPSVAENTKRDSAGDKVLEVPSLSKRLMERRGERETKRDRMCLESDTMRKSVAGTVEGKGVDGIGD